MTGRLQRLPPGTVLLMGLGATVLLALLAVAAPQAAARAWMLALLAWLAIPTGSLLLLLVHTLTGGRWGEALRPDLAATARGLPVLALLFVPALCILGWIYPWAADPAAVRHEDVAALYLNHLGFILRAALTLLLWSGLALFAARPGASRLLAGLGLAGYGLTVSLVAVDWILSLDPHYASTAFAMSLGVSHLLAALAWAGLDRDLPGPVRGDLAQLTLATALGLLYLDLMQFLVVFDGNLPERAAWFLRRGGGAWPWLVAFAVLAASLAPIVTFASPTLRRSPAALRGVGVLVLLGLLARTAWLCAPEWTPGPAFWLASLLALVAVGGLWIGVARGGAAALLRGRRLAHGR